MRRAQLFSGINLASRRFIGLLLLLLALLILFAIPFLPLQPSSNYNGLHSNRPAVGFELHNRHGETVALADFHGHFVYLMFGYMNCDDICHDQAFLFQEIHQAVDTTDNVEFVYVTMDPQRDTPTRLGDYFDARADNFTSLHGQSMAATQQLAMRWGADYALDPAANGDYEIMHRGLVFLVGPDGRLRLTYPPGQAVPSLMLADLAALKKQYLN